MKNMSTISILRKMIIVLAILSSCQILIIKNCIAAFETQASYYDRASCQAEGTWQKWGGLTASGKAYDENALSCASWGHRFGQKVKITHKGKSIIVVNNDRGPSRRLYKAGRKIDLSKQAFRSLAPLSQGVITVTVETVKCK